MAAPFTSGRTANSTSRSGENAVPSNSQSISNRLGKILRINSDGSIPADNPSTFPGIAGSPTGLNRAIWAVGLRNPFTFGFSPGRAGCSSTMSARTPGKRSMTASWDRTTAGPTAKAPALPRIRTIAIRFSNTPTPARFACTGCAIVGGAFYNPDDAAVSRLLRRQILLRRPLQRLDSDFSIRRPARRAPFRESDQHAGRSQGRRRWQPLLSRAGKWRPGLACAVSPAAIALQSAVSRKMHGAAGTFDIALPLTGPAGIEPRSGGATSDHQIVVSVTCNGPSPSTALRRHRSPPAPRLSGAVVSATEAPSVSAAPPLRSRSPVSANAQTIAAHAR